MKRTLTLGLVLLLSCAAGSAASASSGKFNGRADVQSALSGLGVIAAGEAQLETSIHGRVDLGFVSSTPLRKIVAAAKAAYRKGTKLPAKYQLVGYAKMNHRGSWTFTFDRGGYYSVAEIWPNGSGVKVKIKGTTRKIQRRGTSPHPRLPTVRR